MIRVAGIRAPLGLDAALMRELAARALSIR